MVYENAVEAGNKLIANLGVMKMYGQPRKSRVTRLLAEANKGDSQILVGSGHDYRRGDRIAILPTSMVFDAVDDDIFVVSYNDTTGIL